MTQASTHPNWGRHHFGYRANAFMLFVGSRFLWLGYFFVLFAAGWFFVFVPRARRASIAYLDRLGPNRSLRCRLWDTYRHMLTFGQLLLDRAVLLATDAHGFAFTSDGLENIQHSSTPPTGLLLLTAHFGNAEAAAPFLRQRGLSAPINIVMYQNAADSTEKFHARHRTRLAGIAIISTINPLAAGIKIMAALSRNEVVALRADRAMAGKTVAVQFLGQTAHLPAGPFVAAALSGAPVLSVYTVRTGYKQYRCIARPPRTYAAGGERNATLRRAAQDFANDLETLVRQYPLQWSNFYDFWATTSSNAAATPPAPTESVQP